MDKQSNSTTVPEISMVVMGTTRTEELHRLAIEDLRRLSMKELRALIAMLHTLSETACAFLNQSRFTNGRNFNAAGKIGEGFLDHIDWCISTVEQVAKDATPATQEEGEDRAWLLIQRAAHYSDGLPRFVAAAAQLSVQAVELEDV